MNTDNIDRFGHCVVCHKNLIVKRVVDNQVVEMFLPIHDHTDFMLNNGSVMKVCICKPCKASAELSNPVVHSNIMEAVNKGWELETKMLVANEKEVQWTEEYGQSYLNKMRELDIDTHADGLDKQVLVDKSVKLSKEFKIEKDK